MANYFTEQFDKIVDAFAARVGMYVNDKMSAGYSILGNYYQGDQRKQLKTKQGQQDDNVIINYVGLAVDRSVSRLYKGGITFKTPDNADTQQDYLNKVWDLNKKEIILYQVGLHGAVYGTTYFKICPDELTDPYTGDKYPRLVPTDPEIIRVKTDPQDMNEVQYYVINYKIGETAYWEITVRSDVIYDFDTAGNIVSQYVAQGSVEGQESAEPVVTWRVDEWRKVGGAAMEMTSTTPWDYDFPPIIHWKNLPSLKSCYGDSDIDDAINVQDKANFIVSNTGKIIKYHAHPQTIGTGFSVKSMENLEGSPTAFHSIPNPDAKVFNLQMESDLASSRSFALDLRQSIFDISREVDISSIADKLGTLTNFGLQVLWSDATDKNDTKRQLYGDALKELNRRLLVLKGETGPASNPGDIQWGNPLPVNVLEDLQADQLAIDIGIVDKETVAKRWFTRYGVDYETIQANIAKEQASANANNENIGATILRNFNQGVNANGNGTRNPAA